MQMLFWSLHLQLDSGLRKQEHLLYHLPNECKAEGPYVMHLLFMS